MQSLSDFSISECKIVDFGEVSVESEVEKKVSFQNVYEKQVTYRFSYLYILNNIDNVFHLSLSKTTVKPGETTELSVIFKPNIPGQSFTEYYAVDNTAGFSYSLTVTGKCFGPRVSLDKKTLIFEICKNENEKRMEIIELRNESSIDTTYSWLLPGARQGYFLISTGNCGVIRAYETIRIIIRFTGIAIGIYNCELTCLVLHQEPIFLNLYGSVTLPNNPVHNLKEHIPPKSWIHSNPSAHLMENSLNRLQYIPSASVFDTHLDFGTGSSVDYTHNIAQSLCVTNHCDVEGYMLWLSDPDEVFVIDPAFCYIPPRDSKKFTMKFRPKSQNEVFEFMLFGDYQIKYDGGDGRSRVKHTWFRIPCVANTWSSCFDLQTDYDCMTSGPADYQATLELGNIPEINVSEQLLRLEIVLPPTVPTRNSYCNFMLSNKLDSAMYFKFEAPEGSNFALMPMCGVIQGRGWEIMTVAIEPKAIGEYVENWELILNKYLKTRIRLCGNAEIAHVETITHGYNPSTQAVYEFAPTVTGSVNCTTVYMHNLTRMDVHMRALTRVSWLGADQCGSIVLPPKQIIRYNWWFFPTKSNKVYETTITLSCVCLIDGRPVGSPTELFVHIIGFSELPDIRVLPNTVNLNEIVVSQQKSLTVTIYNASTCMTTYKLYHLIDGMGDCHLTDRLEICKPINTLLPSNFCDSKFIVSSDSSGSRRIDIKYTILYNNEYDEVVEYQPVNKTILIIYYDGIYPTIQVKRTISVSCPVIFSDYCIRNIVELKGINDALMNCRPDKPLEVDIYTPELCIGKQIVEIILVLGTKYQVAVPWTLRREKICSCEMVELKIGTSLYEMRHNCFHRDLVEFSPLSGVVTPTNPELLRFQLQYKLEGQYRMCYIMTFPNQREIHIFINMKIHPNHKGLLQPLLKPRGAESEYLAVLDCGRVAVNNIDPTIRIVWLYNPSDVFTTWRLLKSNTIQPEVAIIRCLLYFAEVPPLGKLAIPFSFMPTEMIDYKVEFTCSFGYETVKILVKGQGGLPGTFATRLYVPSYVEKVIRNAHRTNVVYLSKEHITLPVMPTHSLVREVIAVCNDTNHSMRFIWLPERIANIINVVMTPCWGVLPPKSTEWITVSVYTLQKPATLTTTVSCELLDLTLRREYQKNEHLRRTKMEKCNQEFFILEEGTFLADINDCPPYVLDLEKPQPFYLAMTISVSSKGQRDGYGRIPLSQMLKMTPAYDLMSSDQAEGGGGSDSERTSNNTNSISITDVIRIIDGILWDALHSKLFANQIEFYSQEEVPTYKQLVEELESEMKPHLSHRVTSGICDAIVNKAIFHIYKLKSRQDVMSIIDA